MQEVSGSIPLTSTNRTRGLPARCLIVLIRFPALHRKLGILFKGSHSRARRHSGNACVDKISLSTMKLRTCRTPGKYNNCSACSWLKLSLSRVRTSMK